MKPWLRKTEALAGGVKRVECEAARRSDPLFIAAAVDAVAVCPLGFPRSAALTAPRRPRVDPTAINEAGRPRCP